MSLPARTRTNTNVPLIGAGLPFPASLALGAQQRKLDASHLPHRTSRSSIQSVHDYNPFVLEDERRLALELVDRLAILVAARRFHGTGVANSRLLRLDGYVRMEHFVRRSTCITFRRFWGDVPR
jgi:hypothetical protein